MVIMNAHIRIDAINHSNILHQSRDGALCRCELSREVQLDIARVNYLEAAQKELRMKRKMNSCLS